MLVKVCYKYVISKLSEQELYPVMYLRTFDKGTGIRIHLQYQRSSTADPQKTKQKTNK